MQVKTTENRAYYRQLGLSWMFDPFFKRTVVDSSSVAPANNNNYLAALRGGFFISSECLSDKYIFFQTVTFRF